MSGNGLSVESDLDGFPQQGGFGVFVSIRPTLIIFYYEAIHYILPTLVAGSFRVRIPQSSSVVSISNPPFVPITDLEKP
jgi:hypothetical protein